VINVNKKLIANKLKTRISRNTVGGNLDMEGNEEAALWNFG